MSIYQVHGKIPHKRHIVFRNSSGGLYHEELFGTEGFSGMSSLVYHLNPPTLVKEIGKAHWAKPEAVIEDNLKALSFKGYEVEPEKDYLQSRKIFFFNDDLNIGIAAPCNSMEEYFFKNADSDEILFVKNGKGVCKTMYGSIDFEYGDYVIIPRGTVYQLKFETKDTQLLHV